MTVLIADEQPLARYGLKVLVTDILGDVRFLEANDFESLLRAAQLNPTARLALIDLKMPGMLGGYRLLDLARRYPEIPVLVVSTPTSPAAARRIMSIRSVCAFVPKTASTGSLRLAIEAAVRGAGI